MGNMAVFDRKRPLFRPDVAEWLPVTAKEVIAFGGKDGLRAITRLRGAYLVNAMVDLEFTAGPMTDEGGGGKFLKRLLERIKEQVLLPSPGPAF
jgi:hypothetical protein